MGTTIRLTMFKGDCNDQLWEEFLERVYETYTDAEIRVEDDDYIEVSRVHTSYRTADLTSQLAFLGSDKFKDSDIIINLFYEGRDPDEETTL